MKSLTLFALVGLAVTLLVAYVGKRIVDGAFDK
jgi:hypothetical protein